MKPIYFYTSKGPVTVGMGVTLLGVRHPTLRGNIIWTSPVIKFTKSTGRIETLNSVYKPLKKL